MAATRQRRYAYQHSIIISLFLIAVFIPSDSYASNGTVCTKTRVFIELTECDWIDDFLSNTSIAFMNLETLLLKVVNETLRNETGYCGADVVRFNPGSVIAEMQIRVNEEASSITDTLQGKKVGNYSIKLASRLFIVSVNVTSNNTADELVNSTETVLKIGSNFAYVTTKTKTSSFIVLRIGMKQNASEYPASALASLAEAARTGAIGNISVDPGSFAVYIELPKPTQNVFEAKFYYAVSKCISADPNSTEYKILSENVFLLLNKTLHNDTNYLQAKIIKLSCPISSREVSGSSGKVHVTALVFMTLAFSDPNSLGNALLQCNAVSNKIGDLRITFLTPTSAGMPTEAAMICPTTSAPSISTNSPVPKSTVRTMTKSSNPPTTALPPVGRTPRLFVRIRLAMTWTQFCSKMDDSLKQQIARNLLDKKGNRVSPSRIIFINAKRNCVDHTKADEQVDLWLYVANQTDPSKPSKCMTLKAFHVLKMLVENGNTKMLGPDFQGKVISVDLAGCDAKQHIKTSSMPDWTLIMIIIAAVVGVVLLFLACCCICCGAARRRRKRRKERYTNVELVTVDGDGARGKRKGKKTIKDKKDKGKKGKEGKEGKEGDSDVDEKKKKKKKGKSEGIVNDKNGNKDGSKDTKTGNGKTGVNGEANDGYDASYDDGNTNKDKANRSPNGEAVISYENAASGLGDRKPSADKGYANLKNSDSGHTNASIDPSTKRNSWTGGDGGGYEIMIAGAGGAAVAGGTAGLVAGALAGREQKRESLAPTIVTSPTSTAYKANLGNESGTPSSRRGSATLGQQGSPGSRRGSSNLSNIDDELQRERRRSSIHSLIEDDAEPLKHKTATVGIVGLALRNKNERKKETEFKNLDNEMPGPVTYPPNTASKNRDPEILPNPRSRVKLSTSPDYINANYLHDHKGQRRYIATQHPLRETTADFWQMVWDAECYHIVMVNDDEKSKEVDYPQYWPAGEGISMDYGGIVVTTKHITTKPDVTITNLVITNTKMKPSSSREITHYKFTSWKDKVMPNVALFVGFVVASREVSKKYEDGKSPVIVHCSDGQGFTGVFVAVDIGVRSHEESKTSVVDLFEVAKRLRQGRSGIIRSLQHYNFTYQCLYEYTVNYDEEAEKKKE